MILYALALLLPGEIGEVLKGLREKYRNDMTYIPEAHITLKYPFTLKTDLNSAKKSLAAVAENVRPFTLALRGIDFWEKPRRVAFIRIENKEPIMALHSRIMDCVQGQVTTQFEERFDKDWFHPHITIGENIAEPVFPELKAEYSRYEISRDVEISSFSLFSNERGTWKSTENFLFSLIR
jgi:2'-5' RNA ligase